ALVAPILFLLLFGIIEFGRVLNYYNDLTQLSGQGARAAVVNQNPDGSTAGSANADCPEPATGGLTIQCQIAKTYPTDQELKNGISVCIGSLQPNGTITASTPGSIAVGAPVTVRTKYKYSFVTKLFGFGSITLTSTQTERNEGTQSWTGGNVNGPNAPAGQTACTP
ncbi:MAG TPA: TadE family protein, partial [Gaiellaceae bacterium]|nr:TadE family protein [Gaiellaceae bacterium]